MKHCVFNEIKFGTNSHFSVRICVMNLIKTLDARNIFRFAKNKGESDMNKYLFRIQMKRKYFV